MPVKGGALIVSAHQQELGRAVRRLNDWRDDRHVKCKDVPISPVWDDRHTRGPRWYY
ncbi:hypothetical protein AGMMS49992_29450 [Clostridia bacterium]|nr:hypothetical protein AGMMS49992_29450 [Clostridia bacterium]